MTDHDLITIGNRRWCVMCDLFQIRRGIKGFPDAGPCLRTTPRAKRLDTDDYIVRWVDQYGRGHDTGLRPGLQSAHDYARQQAEDMGLKITRADALHTPMFRVSEALRTDPEDAP